MPIMSKSTAMTVYKSAFSPSTDNLLKAAFISIDDTADVMSRGFVNIDDYLDNKFAKSPPQKGRFIAFSLRIDTRRVPGPVIAKHFQTALEQEKADTGKKFITKNRKTEIKDQIRLRLLARAEPIPAVHDVVVDPVSCTVYLCSASKSVKEAFEDTWSLFFNDTLIEQTPAAFVDDMYATAQDFLTAMFNADYSISGVTFSVPNKAVLTSEADKSIMTLEAPESLELPSLSAPMTDAKVAKATVLMIVGDNDFTLTIRAADFGISGLKTPLVEKAKGSDDPDAAFLEKMFLVHEGIDALHQGFRIFSGVGAVSTDF